MAARLLAMTRHTGMGLPDLRHAERALLDVEAAPPTGQGKAMRLAEAQRDAVLRAVRNDYLRGVFNGDPGLVVAWDGGGRDRVGVAFQRGGGRLCRVPRG